MLKFVEMVELVEFLAISDGTGDGHMTLTCDWGLTNHHHIKFQVSRFSIDFLGLLYYIYAL